MQTVLLSGLDYYLNSIIFRGIKLSLIVPILYSAVSYAIIFSEKTQEHFMKKVIKTLTMDIKVYWVIIAGVIGAAGAIYLIRSGNVTSISPFENFIRNTITEIMPARPRTKEFLIGWPALILFLYYIKNTKCTLLQWCFNVGACILFASVINSFCHVFTSAGVIYMRLLNGLMIGVVIGAVFYVINLVLAAFNLLPFYNFDGGKILASILMNFLQEKTVNYIITITSFIILIPFTYLAVYIFMLDSKNFYLLVSAVLMLLTIIFKK